MVFGAGIATGTVFLVTLTLQTVLTLNPSDLGAAPTRALYQASIELGAASSFLIAPLVAAQAVTILRHGGLPRWLGFGTAKLAA